MEIGKLYTSNNSGQFEVLSRHPGSFLTIRFVDTQNTVFVRKGNALKGNVRDAKRRNYYDIGYIGDTEENIKNSRTFNVWQGMLSRCYAPSGNESYKDCEVCEEWQCYTTFKGWYENQQHHTLYQIDKDLLFRGNRTYSPETCVLLPKAINVALQGNRKNRGAYPTGVYYKKRNKNFTAQIAYGDSVPKHLGSFKTWQEAEVVYLRAKEGRIRAMAEEYKEVICERAYVAMLNWSAS